MENYLDKFGKLCIQDGFIQGVEAMRKQLENIEKKLPLKDLPADFVFKKLRKKTADTIAGLKERQRKQWNAFQAECSKENKQ